MNVNANRFGYDGVTLSAGERELRRLVQAIIKADESAGLENILGGVFDYVRNYQGQTIGDAIKQARQDLAEAIERNESVGYCDDTLAVTYAPGEY